MPESRAAKPSRLHSLDAFRGATIAAMLLVNNPGGWSHIYPPLRHAAWHGWTPTDLIFPFFVFIMGTAMAFSLARFIEGRAVVTGAIQRRIARRVLLLIGLGLLLNAFPSFDLGSLRWPGVLQRLGLVYALAAIVVLWVPLRAQVAIAVVTLLAYWGLLVLVPIEGVRPALTPEANLPRALDLALIPEAHLYTGSPTDPEGLLSTYPAVITCLLGYWAGRWVKQDHDRECEVRADSDDVGSSCPCALRRLLWVGLGLTVSGLLWGLIFPINKPLWTSSYVLLTAGLAMLALCAAHWLIDRRGWRWIGRPFEAMGVNAIVAFVLAGLLARVLTMIEIEPGIHARIWLFIEYVELTYDSNLASLMFAGTFVLVMWVIVAVLSKLGLRLRV